MTKVTINLSAPWYTYYRKLTMLFGDDPDIELGFDEDSMTVEMFVNGTEKYEAIMKILPAEVKIGNVTLHINIVPSNKEDTVADIFRKAFSGNPAFSYAATVEGITTNPVNYIVFKNKVVQFWNDNLGDINGNMSTLYQDIAKEVFTKDSTNGALFCTDTEKNLGVPD